VARTSCAACKKPNAFLRAVAIGEARTSRIHQLSCVSNALVERTRGAPTRRPAPADRVAGRYRSPTPNNTAAAISRRPSTKNCLMRCVRPLELLAEPKPKASCTAAHGVRPVSNGCQYSSNDSKRWTRVSSSTRTAFRPAPASSRVRISTSANAEA
jgi:hypothetical protein